MNPPDEVLRQYTGLPWRAARFLGNRGGFSGARLWRLESAAGVFCLKAWPADDMTAERLARIHRWIAAAHANGIDFVPQTMATAAGNGAVHYDGRLWDIAAWLPGAADFHAHPSPARLASAGVALARLHGAWEKGTACRGPSPVVQRRLDALRRWRELTATSWRPAIAADDPVQPWAEHAWRLLPAALPRAEQSLMPWCEVLLPLHPCWCDPWHDHVLFTGERVSGLIDYGGVKEDHAAIDIARMLGSFVGDDPVAWTTFLAAYQTVRPLTAQERVFVAVLEQVNVVTALATWLRWLYHDRRDFENRGAIADRLRQMVTRLELANRATPSLFAPGPS